MDQSNFCMLTLLWWNKMGIFFLRLHSTAQPFCYSQQTVLDIYTVDYSASKQNTISDLFFLCLKCFYWICDLCFNRQPWPHLKCTVCMYKETETHFLSFVFAAGEASELLIEANKLFWLSKQTWS